MKSFFLALLILICILYYIGTKCSTESFILKSINSFLKEDPTTKLYESNKQLIIEILDQIITLPDYPGLINYDVTGNKQLLAAIDTIFKTSDNLKKDMQLLLDRYEK